MAKTDVKVAEKKVAVDYKALAESVEKAFKADKTVDVIADSNLEYPKSMTEPEYRYIHFYIPGTEKNMFGLYIKHDRALFAVSSSVELDKSLNAQPVIKNVTNKETGEKSSKTAYILVTCKFDEIADTAKKIIAAYQAKPAKKAAEKKVGPKKAAEKKPAKATTATPKKSTKKVDNK